MQLDWRPCKCRGRFDVPLGARDRFVDAVTPDGIVTDASDNIDWGKVSEWRYAQPAPPQTNVRPEKAHPLAQFGSPDVAPLGLYRVYWKSGGSSLAAIGMMENGDRWIAPTNWIRPGTVASAGEWGEIERLEPIEPPPENHLAVSIKPLAWEEGNPANNYPVWRAQCYALGFSAKIDKGEPLMYGKFPVLINGRNVSEKFGTLEDARAFIEADYRRRVLALVEISTPPQTNLGRPAPVRLGAGLLPDAVHGIDHIESEDAASSMSLDNHNILTASLSIRPHAGNNGGSNRETSGTCCPCDPNNDPNNENIQPPQNHSLRPTIASKPEAQPEKDNAGKSDDDGPHPSVGSLEGAKARAIDEVPIVADALQYSSQDEHRRYDPQQPFLHKPHYHSTLRTAILEEAATVAETGDYYGQFQTAGDERRAKAIAERIRALATTGGSANA